MSTPRLERINSSTSFLQWLERFWFSSRSSSAPARPDSVWVDLLLNIGATLISTAVLAFLYQRFGSENLIQQISEMRRSLRIAQLSHELGLRDMWCEQRDIPSSMWNTFTASAQSQVWLFGVAELGFAEDPNFHRIVSDGTARGCSYRFLVLDPGSEIAVQLDHREGGGNQVQGRIRRALVGFLRMQRHNVGKRGSVEVRIYDDSPRVSIVRSDNELLVTSYVPPLLGSSSFTFHVQNVPSGVFAQYTQYFEANWDRTHPPIPEEG